MIKILCIGDIHIKTKNFSDINILLKEIEHHLINTKNPYDLIVVLGDTLDTHRRVDSECLTKANEYFLMLEKYSPVLILVGNHDYINNSQFLTNKHWLNSFKTSKHKLTIVDDITILNIKNFKILALPYVPDGKFKFALYEKLGKDFHINIKPDIIFAHQTFNGVSMGSIDKFMNAEDWNYDIQVVSGHIHDRQVIKIPKSKKTIYYTGSSLQHSFGEKYDKTIANITIDEKKHIKIEEIKLNLPIRKVIHCNVSDVSNELSKLDIKKMSSGMLKIKLSLNGNSDDYKSFIKTKLYRDSEKKGIKFDFKGEFKDELYKQLSQYEKNSKNDVVEEKKMKTHVDFFDLLDFNIKNDKELIDIHENIIEKLPNIKNTRNTQNNKRINIETETNDDILII